MFKESLLLIWRSRLIALGGVITTAIVLVALCAGLFSGRQPETVALDVGISIIRMSTPLITFFLLHEVVSKDFFRKHYLRNIAAPVSRSNILICKFFAILFFNLIFVFLALCGVALVAEFISAGYKQGTSVSHEGLALASIFMILDFTVVLSLGLFVSTFTNSTGFLFVSILGFSVISRAFKSVVDLLSAGEPVGIGVSMLSRILPDLSALDVRGVALYGRMEFIPAEWPSMVVSALGYSICLLALAVWSLQHKRFN